MPAQIAAFADAGSLAPVAAPCPARGPTSFRWSCRRHEPDGLGILILNSNAEAHFSFTNALGVVSADQERGLAVAIRQFPSARWVVAMHHHPVEYPDPAAAFSERIGTALINGSWFVRRLKPFARRIVVMHGHRHIDWIGACGALRIVSAPSPVMEGTDDTPNDFYIHVLAPADDGGLALLAPDRIGFGRGP